MREIAISFVMRKFEHYPASYQKHQLEYLQSLTDENLLDEVIDRAMELAVDYD